MCRVPLTGYISTVQCAKTDFILDIFRRELAKDRVQGCTAYAMEMHDKTRSSQSPSRGETRARQTLPQTDPLWRDHFMYATTKRIAAMYAGGYAASIACDFFSFALFILHSFVFCAFSCIARIVSSLTRLRASSESPLTNWEMRWASSERRIFCSALCSICRMFSRVLPRSSCSSSSV